MKLTNYFMHNIIQDNLENPEKLESLYRRDPKEFSNAFYELFPTISDSKIAQFWKVRLDAAKASEGITKVKKLDILYLIISCLITGILIEIPNFFGIANSDKTFYVRNGGLIVFFGLSLFSFFTYETKNSKHILFSAFVFAISAIYANLLPTRETHTITLVYIHLPLMIWCLFGLIYVNFDLTDKKKIMGYIKFNGDLIIMSSLFLISGGILTGITINLFAEINLDIEYFYTHYIAQIGLVSIPIVAVYVIRNYQYISNKIAPIIANIFRPLVLLTLLAYLTGIIITGNYPYNDRNSLLVFNLMLIGVLGIVVFSISERSNKKNLYNELILFFLTFITLVINLVALSAIVYRLGEFGFSPNRIAVLGSNVLIFGNLLLIMFNLFRVIFNKKEINQLEDTIANYLPIYALWTIFIIFVLPYIYSFR